MKMTIQEYYDNYKRKSDLLDIDRWSTLKAYKDERDKLSKKIIDCCSIILYSVCPRFYVKIEKENFSYIKKYFDIVGTPIVDYTGSINVEYWSKSKKWGEYNPQSFYNIVKKYTYNVNNVEIVLSVNVYREYLGHGRNKGIRKSGICSTRKRKYNKAILTEHFIKFEGKILNSLFIFTMNGLTYHTKSNNFKEDYKLLLNKIERKKENRKSQEKSRKEQGKLITLSFLEKKFGWCEYGINGFLDITGWENRPTRAKEILNKYKRLPKDIKESIHSEYGSEVTELLVFCKNNV